MFGYNSGKSPVTIQICIHTNVLQMYSKYVCLFVYLFIYFYLICEVFINSNLNMNTNDRFPDGQQLYTVVCACISKFSMYSFACCTFL